ncbi:hypothetical protein KA531_02090 [Candidatus Saccharibacteria bacterium]|nr:hypothetical protein [Candidatus Saccharibacteria bacterium]
MDIGRFCRRNFKWVLILAVVLVAYSYVRDVTLEKSFQNTGLEGVYSFPWYLNDDGGKSQDLNPEQEIITSDNLDQIRDRLDAQLLVKEDQVFIFTKANVGVVYRPKENKIVHLFTPSAINLRKVIYIYGDNLESLKVAKQKLTQTYGAALIIKTVDLAELIDIGVARVVDIKGDEPGATGQIADSLGLSVSSETPDNLDLPEDASFLVIVD